MGATTEIAWTDSTWNPVTGCQEVSPGCDHCYAKTIAERFRGGPAYPQGFDVTLRPHKLDQPLRWRRPRRVFVNSMSDLFHDSVPDDYIAQVWAVMAYARWHTFQVLTKRHGRMRSLLSSERFVDLFDIEFCKLPDWVSRWPSAEDAGHLMDGPLPNVWLGVSAEDARWAKIRGDALRETPAAVRFFSCEPLLGPIADLDLTGIGWVICGGESGHGARPMHPDWARSLRDQCTTAGVPFYYKQTGEWLATLTDQHRDLPATRGDRFWNPQAWVNKATGAIADEDTAAADGGDWIGVWRVGKKAAGRQLDGETWNQYPGAVS